MTATNDVTNYEVRIRLDPIGFKDLIDPTKPKKFPFRPGMNASADIKTKRHENVLSIAINAVAARIKGSDKNIEDKKKEDSKNKNEAENNNVEDNSTTAADLSNELEEVVFVLQKDNKVKKVVVKTGIQDINNIEVLSGLKEGEEIISGPYNAISKTLKDGTKVKVVPKDKLFATTK